MLFFESKTKPKLSTYQVNVKQCSIYKGAFSTARKVSKYGVFSGPYFSVFGTEKTIRIWTLFTQCRALSNNSDKSYFSKIVVNVFSGKYIRWLSVML